MAIYQINIVVESDLDEELISDLAEEIADETFETVMDVSVYEVFP